PRAGGWLPAEAPPGPGDSGRRAARRRRPAGGGTRAAPGGDPLPGHGRAPERAVGGGTRGDPLGGGRGHPRLPDQRRSAGGGPPVDRRSGRLAPPLTQIWDVHGPHEGYERPGSGGVAGNGSRVAPAGSLSLFEGGELSDVVEFVR